MNHTFHCHLRKSFHWYNDWHNHHRHQHTHWSAFLIAVFSVFSFLSGQINLPYPQTIQGAQAESAPNYTGDLRAALDKVIASNPNGVADALNDTRENKIAFLNAVAVELQAVGFNATTNVLNGHNLPNSGDLIAIWRPEDITLERYDAIVGTDIPIPIRDATRTEFTGDIPLNCANDGGGKNCADPNLSPDADNYSAGSSNVDSGGTPFKSRPILPPPPATDFNQLINNTFTYAILIVGIAVFIMIMWGGFLWVTSAANPGNIATAKKKIYNAILGAVFLFSIYVILNTINPELVKGTLKLPGLEAPTSVMPPVDQPPTAICSNSSALAQQFNNAAFPKRIAAELAALMVCVESNPAVSNLIDKTQVYTFENENNLCNYTRGNTLCGTCAHRVASCHYGGAAGRDGALAVDYNARDSSPNGEQQLFNALKSLKSTCGFDFILFEQTHTHISTASCTGN